MADIFTKTLDERTTIKHMSSLGLRYVGVVACWVELKGFRELFASALVANIHLSLLDRYELMTIADWLVLEFCTPVDSSMSEAAKSYD